MTKNIGKPCTGKPYARFDEGALMVDDYPGHVVAACGGALLERTGEYSLISALLYPDLFLSNGPFPF